MNDETPDAHPIYPEWDPEKFIAEYPYGKIKEFATIKAAVDWGYPDHKFIMLVGYDADGKIYVIDDNTSEEIETNE